MCRGYRGHPLIITKTDPMEEPMRIYKLSRTTLPKIAVLGTGLAVAVMAGTIHPLPAQATPRASSCTGCHAAADGTTSTVTATPSTATPAPGATYTVAITLSANPTGGDTGYGIVAVAPTPAPVLAVKGGMLGTSALFYTETQNVAASDCD